jgi:GcrA cell cycle regulator
MSWTDDRIETLRKLWADGLSASQIATALGGVSRNAVIGKIHRLGLSGRVKAPPRAQAPRRPTAMARPAPQARVMAAAAAVVRVVERPLPAFLPQPQPQAQTVADVLPFTRGVTFLELGPQQCRWPLGDPGDGDFKFCGARTGPGETYCCGHADLAFPGRAKKRKG